MDTGQDDWASEVGAVIVLRVFRLRCPIKAILIRIEDAVTDIVVRRAVELAAAGPSLNNELSGGGIPILGG